MNSRMFLLAFIYAVFNFFHLLQAQFEFESVSTVPDWILLGHVIETLTPATLGSCFMACSEVFNCYSMNLYPSIGVCELNNAINDSHPQDFHRRDGGVYLVNLFRRAPCNDTFCPSGSGRCFMNGLTRGCDIVCADPLGIEDGTIPNSAMSASSSYGTSQDYGHHARLRSSNAWQAKNNQPGAWLQVNLGRMTVVTGVASQGSPWHIWKHVKKYSVTFGLDGINFETYTENGQTKIFTANSASPPLHAIVTNTLKNKIVTKIVRLVVHEAGGLSVMRIELYGCQLP